MDKRLSEPQARIFDFIVKYGRVEGRPPTNREIGQAVGIKSTGHVDHHLNALETKGMITRVRGKSRGIRVNYPQREGSLQVIGSIAAGSPLDLYTDTDRETFEMGSEVSGSAYVLVVKGDSMIEDHIENGDFVLIDPNISPENGDIVVALHMSATTEAGAATLKRIYKEQGHVRLQPANAALEPFIIDKDEWDNEWKVQGKVIAVYRRC